MSLHQPTPQEAVAGDMPKPATLANLDGATLDRLMAEVRNAGAVEAGRYNRLHNRHNRS